MGIHKFYMTWALYAFTCEPLGQQMMYPDRFPPGADPDAFLINKNNWQDLKTPDFTTGIPKTIDGILSATQELTGVPPLLQISAPYSLAADIYGQEPLLADVVSDPNTSTRCWITWVMRCLDPGWIITLRPFPTVG